MHANPGFFDENLVPRFNPHTPDWQQVPADWQDITQPFFSSTAGQSLLTFLRNRHDEGALIYPEAPLRALHLTPRAQVRVVILGQDPYHGAGQAEGLAFSVAQGVKTPPSLRNMFKERQRDLGIGPAAHGSLIRWAEQGVLLLNTTLTVEDGAPASHAQRGWEALTDALIAACAQKPAPVVFMLWGAHAQAKRAIIESHKTHANHLVLTANHPSPLSATRGPAPFIGCGHFGAARAHLQRQGDSLADLLFL